MTRRGFCALAAGSVAASFLGCSKDSSTTSRLVVYCSADAEVALPLLELFTQSTGVHVDPVFDTEATKTTGLVNRLLAEKSRPRADVWWSSEPFGTIRLAQAGVLAAYRSAAAESSVAGGWPAMLKDSNAEPRWYGFGSRARVFVRNTKLVPENTAPTAIEDLLDTRFAGRVGIARPQFGTTRGHMAAILAARGEDAFIAWLKGLRAAGVRLLDGNAAIARAVATGELHVGLTDSDDVFAGQQQGWPIAASFEREASRTLVLIPNTVARVAGGPGGDGASALVDFLLSTKAQRALALTPSKNLPVDSALQAELGSWLPTDQRTPTADLTKIAGRIERAIELCERELGA